MQHDCYMQFLTEYMQIVTYMLVTMAYYMHVTCTVTCRDLGHFFYMLHAGFMQASVMPTYNGCLLHDCYVQEGCMEFACNKHVIHVSQSL